MKTTDMTNETFLRLAREEDNCSILAGSLQGVFQKKESSVQMEQDSKADITTGLKVRRDS